MAEPGDVLYAGYVLEKKYKVGRLLGRGGFGATYLAQDLNLRVPVAIKEFLPRQIVGRSPSGTGVYPYSGNEHAFKVGLEQFLSEARNLARFRGHPGIISVLDFFPENGTGYMVMEYLDGSTLEQYIGSAGRLDIQVALRLIIPVADALRACHAVGLIHRDVSPDNIFLTSDGQVKILDFGAARFATGAQTTALSVILKAGYAPFEQYQQNGRQGPWTDIYALTATLYRLVTGSLPVPAVDRVAAVALPPVARKLGKVPSNFQALLDRGLALRPEERYQSVDAFSADAQAVLAAFDHAPSPPPMAFAHRPSEPETGENAGHVGQYELRSVLARTARSVVYDGWDQDGGRQVAVKAILLPGPQDGDAEAERTRLKHRVMTMQTLVHPNIVGVYDCVDTSDSVYIVMEFVDGPSLHQVLNTTKRLDLGTTHKIIDGVLQGLQHSHGCAVMHGNISPGSILLTGGRTAKIKFASAQQEIGNAKQLGGVTRFPAFMSPEQFLDGTGDWRSDIYSAAVVLYCMITGRNPFEGSLGTITNKVLKSPVARPSSVSPMVSAALDHVVMRAMAKKPEQRFRSAAQFSAALSAALDRPGFERPPIGPRFPAWRTLIQAARENAAVVGGAAGVIAVVAAAGATWFWPTEPEPARLAVARPGLGEARPVDARPVDVDPKNGNKGPPAADQRIDSSPITTDAEPDKATPPAPESEKASTPLPVPPPPSPPPPSEPERLTDTLQVPDRAQPSLPPSPPPVRTPNAGPSPQATARKPGGAAPGIEPGTSTAEKSKNPPAVVTPPKSRLLEETMNRLRNESEALASRPPPDRPAAPASPPPPAYPTFSTSVVGLTCQTVTDKSAQELKLDAPKGLWCTGVTVGSAAASAGIQADDVLLSANGSELRDLGALKKIAAAIPAGQKVPVEILRAGRPVTVYLALDKLRS